MHALRPTAQDVRDLALRETDPLYYCEFEPIALGAAGNAAVLLIVGLAAAIALPVRLLARVLGKR